MEQIISPFIFYTVCVLGAAGVALALPRRGSRLVPLGVVLIAGAVGLAALAMGMRAPAGSGPGLFFYIFAAIGLGAGVRMVTHPRPVYSALYFILTIIASCGMYVLLGAEFMAFALVIIYAGAILITYLFVIMLATQAPSGQEPGMLDETDAVAREPVVGAVVGFVLMGLIAGMLFNGVGSLAVPRGFSPDAVLANLPGKVETALRDADLIEPYETVRRIGEGVADIDPVRRTITVQSVRVADGEEFVSIRVIGPEGWPEGLEATNLDRLGWNLLNDHPMTIEIAGVILLMAMLGATVLARKHFELEESLKEAQVRRLGDARPAGSSGGTA